MKRKESIKTFKDVKKGDTLYLVYLDPNGDRQIGEAAVTGFTDWTYRYGDRYEDYGERDVRNVNFKFQGVKFSRDLTYILNDTHTLSGAEFGEEYENVMGDAFVEVFTTRGLAKEYLVSLLGSFIESKQEQIAELESEIEKFRNNLDSINNI